MGVPYSRATFLRKIGACDMTDKVTPCGCGRSPTGQCIGWHKLTEAEYQEKLAQYQADHATESKDDQAPSA